MIPICTVDEATDLMLGAARDFGTEDLPLQETVGRILREKLIADRDFPPFDRIAMDGIAIRYAAWEQGRSTFRITGIQGAGAPPQQLPSAEACIEVMTGSVLPLGADTVVPYEQLQISGKQARVAPQPAIRPKQHVHPKGEDRRQGDVLVSPGHRLAAADIGLAATVGKASLRVSRMPRTAVVSTGDELVPIGTAPADYQIRISNAPALQAAFLPLGLRGDIYHLPDDRRETLLFLRNMLAKYELLVLTGGISRGKYDFVPTTLADAGVRPALTGVRQRPGKPLWFGQSETTTVFGLPGNPVSALLGAHRYVLPWLRACLGLRPFPGLKVQLDTEVPTPKEATYFLPVVLTDDKEGKEKARHRPGKGSGDLANLALVSGFLEIPPEMAKAEAGGWYRYFPVRPRWP